MLKLSARGSVRNWAPLVLFGDFQRQSGSCGTRPFCTSSEYRRNETIGLSRVALCSAGRNGAGCQYGVGELTSRESCLGYEAVDDGAGLLSAELFRSEVRGIGIGSEAKLLAAELAPFVFGGDLLAIADGEIERSLYLLFLSAGNVELLGLLGLLGMGKGDASGNKDPCEARGEGSGEEGLALDLLLPDGRDCSGARREDVSGSSAVRRGYERLGWLPRWFLASSVE